MRLATTKMTKMTKKSPPPPKSPTPAAPAQEGEGEARPEFMEDDDDSWIEAATRELLPEDWDTMVPPGSDASDEDIEAHNQKVKQRLVHRRKVRAEQGQIDELLDEDHAEAEGDEEEEEEEEAEAEAEAEGEGEGEEEEAEEGEGEGGEGGEGEGEGSQAAQPPRKRKAERQNEPEDAAEQQTLENVWQPYLVKYGRYYYGVPKDYILLDAEEPLIFETREEYNAMWNSKSPDPFKEHVRLRHMLIVRSSDRHIPKGWVKGVTDDRTEDDFPYRTYMYVISCVRGDPDDRESMMRMEHDQRVLRFLTKAVAKGLHAHFMQLKTIKENREGRADAVRPFVDWRMAEVDPGVQVSPIVEKWFAWAKLVLLTAFLARESEPRTIGPNSKKATKGAEQVAVPQAKRSGGKKAARVTEVEPDVEAAETEEPEEAGSDGGTGATDEPIAPHPVANPSDVVCNVTYYKVDNGAKTTCYVTGNYVAVIEHH